MRLALRVRFLLSSELFTPRTGRDEEDGEEEMVLLLFYFQASLLKSCLHINKNSLDIKLASALPPYA